MLLSFSRRPSASDDIDAAAALPRERERLAAVARFAPDDPHLREAAGLGAQIAAALFGTGIGVCTLVGGDAVRVLGAVGLDGVRELPREPGLCVTTVASGRTRQVERTDLDRKTCAHPLVTGPLRARFYAAAPLLTHDGYAVGTLAALDREPRSVGPRELAALEALAALTLARLESAPQPDPDPDALTGLPPRRRFEERLEQLDREATWERSWGALAALDVDGLERIGGRLDAGAERALCALAAALCARFEGEAEVFRVDASEFAIVAGVGATYDAARIRLRIDEAFRTVQLAGYPEVRARAGVVTFEEAAAARVAFRLADWRMYAEKLERR